MRRVTFFRAGARADLTCLRRVTPDGLEAWPDVTHTSIVLNPGDTDER
jgi:hypothetical protein